MHSHHSHSGDYVSHAVGSLDDMVLTAEQRGFTKFCLTEHMPRLHDRYLYPEEIEKSYTTTNLQQNFDNYLEHAVKIREQHANSTMKILVGFEVEGLDKQHIDYASEIRKNPVFDMCVGSVHHVHGIPIDFSPDLWVQAQQQAREGTARQLFRDYYDLQHVVIDQLEPEVIGHFDLIRLFAPLDAIDPTTNKKLSDIDIQRDWPEVWAAIERNIRRVVQYGGLFEVNSAAVRKGWDTPYPQRDVATKVVEYGGKFCLSDDSHALAQVGLNYHKSIEYLESLGVKSVYYLASGEKIEVRSESLEEVKKREESGRS